MKTVIKNIQEGFNKLNTFKKICLIYCFTVCSTWLVLFIYNSLHSTVSHVFHDTYTPFSKDYGFHFCWMLIIPVFMVYYYFNLKDILHLKEKLLGLKFKHINDIKYFSTFGFDLFISSVGIIIFTIFAFENMTHKSWWMPSISGTYFLIIYFFIICSVSIALGMSIFSISFQLAKEIKRNLSLGKNLKIEIYHSDGCAGLSWITLPFLKLLIISIPLYLIGLASIVSLVFIRHYDWTNKLVIWNIIWPTLYGPILTFFLIQSTGIRKFLLKEKEKRLDILSGKISIRLNTIFKKHKSEKKYISIEDSIDDKNINELIELYRKIDKDFPVWPVPKQLIALSAGSGPLVSLVNTAIILYVNVIL